MKVYIVTKEPFPNGMAATNRIKCYARAIIAGGVDCEVDVCAASELPEKVRNKEFQGTSNGVPFVYPGGRSVRSKVRAFRPFYDWIDHRTCERYLSRNLKSGDVLFMYMGGMVETMLRFMNIAEKKGAFCVRDLCEFPYGTEEETKHVIKMRKVTLEQQFPKLDGIICISNALLNLAKTYTLSSCKLIKVPILVDYDYYCIVKKPEPPLIPYIFHAGTLTQQKDGILGMLEAFGIAKQRLESPIRYILTGSIEKSSHPGELCKIISKYHLEHSLEFVGYLFPEQVKNYLYNASLVISNRPKSKQDYYGFSTKIGEYLASGTPLVTTNWGEAVNWLENGKSAIITDPEDTEALADAIVRVFTQSEDARRIGLIGQEVCRDSFDYHNWSKPLVDFFNQLGK